MSPSTSIATLGLGSYFGFREIVILEEASYSSEPYEIVPSDDGRNFTPIIGKAQTTVRNGVVRSPWHASTILAKATAWAKSGRYERIFLDRSWRSVAGTTGEFSLREPDAIGVRFDGKYDALEVASDTDTVPKRRQRVLEAMSELPAEKRGNIEIVDKPVYQYSPQPE